MLGSANTFRCDICLEVLTLGDVTHVWNCQHLGDVTLGSANT
jgi:hypothetical protein